MKVIIFGGSGFLGSHVADVLSERCYKVTIFDISKPKYLKEDQISIVGDINDEKKVTDAIKDCDIVYNFAGISDIEEAKKSPFNAIKNNILGNTVLLEASRNAKVKRFVFASTLYVYSEAGSFYRSSKQACELLIDNYQKAFGLDYTILRYGSLYGPGSNEHNWIYKVLKQALIEGKISRSGDGEEIREYIHVFDVARLSVDILSTEYKNQHVIITGNQQIKVKDLLIMIKEMLNNRIKLEYLPVNYKEHYEITPYNFTPRLAKRIQSNNYVDLGQGILDMMKIVYQKYKSEE